MTKPKHPIKMYVVSTALVTSLAFTPALSEKVLAKANVNSSDTHSSIDVSESTLLSKGDRGEAVKSVQSELASQGYYTYNLDGIFGPITKEAVESFQSDHGITIDGIVGPETKEALSSSSVESMKLDSNSTDAASESEVVSIAENLIGTPYVWGGTTPDGFDSSGFVSYVFDQVGINLHRTEHDMWTSDGVRVDSPRIGDVIFFEGTYDTEGASHSGIYIGDNKMIHAGSEGVAVADLSIDYWQDHYLGVKSFQ
ncbi:Putative peptidoglycan binding domain-containing protein [Lentibacillus halodurans]|uniref:Putative peptidoglycan binding domain-containing protein n=1 Tax=Lentibacillus halodurans TaxID=237679 RepID=A0A1I1AFC5_9BACI|nr:NlpC/P60 family protein [Lentibacillus halodurans]SFB36182.1 Putative peptidoglycan binding domain-containing protein [Lentibacillus halodurans]